MSDSSNEKMGNGGKFGGMGRVFTLSMSKEDNMLTRTTTMLSIKGKIKMRGQEDEEPQYVILLTLNLAGPMDLRGMVQIG
jgi:hypothetical protein